MTAQDPTLACLLRRRASEHPSRLAYAFLDEGRSLGPQWTFAELDRRARAIAAMLQESVGRGERALLLYPQGLDFLAALLGCMQSGVIAVPATAPESHRVKRSLPRVESIASDARVTAVLTDSAVLAVVESFIESTPGLRRMRWLRTETISPERADSWTEETAAPDDVAYLQYTSGSTSSPNGVVISHNNLMHQLAYLTEANRYTADSVTVTWMPHFHDYGLVEGLLEPLYNGTPCYFMEPLAFIKRPSCWLRAITVYSGTHTQAPNFAYDHCVRRITAREREGLDLRTWKQAGNAAEPINPRVMQEFIEAFGPIGFRPEAMCPAFGLAEATLLVSTSPTDKVPPVLQLDANALEQGRVEPASTTDGPVRSIAGCGEPICDTRVVVADPKTRTRCAADEIGEIWVADPSVAQGYWNKPEETERTFGARLADTGEGPFLRTGDLGFVRDGEIFIAGRLKDLIIIRGANFYPPDIEWTVQRCHPALELGYGAAFPILANGDERLVIFQELKRGLEPGHDMRKVVAAVRQAVAEEFEIRPYAVVLLNPGQIPKTSSGKIQRRACRSLFLDASLDPVHQWIERSPPDRSLRTECTS